MYYFNTDRTAVCMRLSRKDFAEGGKRNSKEREKTVRPTFIIGLYYPVGSIWRKRARGYRSSEFVCVHDEREI